MQTNPKLCCSIDVVAFIHTGSAVRNYCHHICGHSMMSGSFTFIRQNTRFYFLTIFSIYNVDSKKCNIL